MTQDDFDTLIVMDEIAPDLVKADVRTPEDDNVSAVKPSFLGSMFGTLRTQRPVRLAAFAIVAAGGAFALTTLPGSDATRTQIAAISEMQAPAMPSIAAVQDVAQADRQSAAASDMPILPSDPDTMPALAAAPLRAIDNIQPTAATTSAPACTTTVEAMPLAGALVALDIAAPCDESARVDIFQGDLQIAVSLDGDGKAQVEMPALSATATVAVVVEGRDPVSVISMIPDVADYTRTVLYWQNDAGLELHAFEDGAGYGAVGHIGPETPRTISHVLSGSGGYLARLGDASLENARMALIYTAPVAEPAGVSVEAAVMAGNCGQEILAGTIQIAPGLAPSTQDLMFTMPGCDAEGDYVLLGELKAPVAAAAKIDRVSN